MGFIEKQLETERMWAEMWADAPGSAYPTFTGLQEPFSPAPQELVDRMTIGEPVDQDYGTESFFHRPPLAYRLPPPSWLASGPLVDRMFPEGLVDLGRAYTLPMPPWDWRRRSDSFACPDRLWNDDKAWRRDNPWSDEWFEMGDCCTEIYRLKETRQ